MDNNEGYNGQNNQIILHIEILETFPSSKYQKQVTTYRS